MKTYIVELDWSNNNTVHKQTWKMRYYVKSEKTFNVGETVIIDLKIGKQQYDKMDICFIIDQDYKYFDKFNKRCTNTIDSVEIEEIKIV